MKMDRKEVEELVSKMEDFLNAMNNRDNHIAFVDAVQDMHRRLQQNLMAQVWLLIEAWAKNHESGNYDLRNEATCKLCSEIIEKFGKNHFPFI